MPNEDQKEQPAGPFVDENIHPDAAGHVQPSVNHEQEAHESLAGTGAAVTSDAALATPTHGVVTIPEPNQPNPDEQLPKHRPHPRDSRFGRFMQIKKRMEQKVMKRRQGKLSKAA